MTFFRNWRMGKSTIDQAQAPTKNFIDPSAWTIGPILNGKSRSPQMPLKPSHPWQFKFPNGDGVHGVTCPVANPTRVIMIRYRIEAQAGTRFQAYHQGQPEPGAPKLTLYLQGRNVDWTGPGTRWYSNESMPIIAGTWAYSARINEPRDWHGVNGERYERDPGRWPVIRDISHVGFGLGGTFDMHGVGVVMGAATFFLEAFNAE